MTDPKWDGVYATVDRGPFQKIQFHIEIARHGHTLGQRFLADPRELEEVPGAYGYILDRMVRELDKALHA